MAVSDKQQICVESPMKPAKRAVVRKAKTVPKFVSFDHDLFIAFQEKAIKTEELVVNKIFELTMGPTNPQSLQSLFDVTLDGTCYEEEYLSRSLVRILQANNCFVAVVMLIETATLITSNPPDKQHKSNWNEEKRFFERPAWIGYFKYRGFFLNALCASEVISAQASSPSLERPVLEIGKHEVRLTRSDGASFLAKQIMKGSDSN